MRRSTKDEVETEMKKIKDSVSELVRENVQTVKVQQENAQLKETLEKF